MAEGRPVGTMFVELSLDATKYTKAQKDILAGAERNSADIEKTFKRVGITSDAMYDAMRKNVQNSLDAILRSHVTTAAEKVRAEQAAAEKIRKINEQQFGHQATLLETMKKNYVATAAIVVAAWVAVNKAMAFAEMGAKAEQAEESFRIVASSAGESADKILDAMKRAAAGTVDDSDIMQKAVKGMVLGLKGDEMVNIMEAARVSARVAGEDVKTAYEGITDAIATQMPKALKRYGLITKEEMALVSKALQAGVEDVNLYRIAMLNAEIQAARMGEVQSNAAERLQAFNAIINDAKENVGKFAIELGQRLLGAFYGFAGALTKIAAPLAYLIGGQEAYNAMNESGNDLMRTAAKLAGVQTEEEKKAAAAAQEGAKARIAAAEAAKKAETDHIKAQIESAEQAKKAKAERERYEKEIADTILKNSETIKAIGLSQYEQEIAQVKAKVAEYKKAGVSQVMIAQYVASETAVAAKKAADAWDQVMSKIGKPDLVGLDKTLADIAQKYDDIRKKFKGSPAFNEEQLAGAQGAETGRAEWEWNVRTTEAIRKNEEQMYAERDKAREEFDKRLQESMNWRVNAHDRAIATIISKEAEGIAKNYEAWESGYISLAELDAANAEIRSAADAGRQAQQMQYLADVASQYQNLLGFEEVYYNKSIELLNKKIELLAKEYGLTKDVTDAMKKQGANAIADAATERRMDEIVRKTSGYAAMLEGIGDLYDKNSKQSKVAHDAASAASIIQQALLLKEAIAAAVVAVATQGKGDPYTAFARVAAMIAMMASVLSQAGISFGGGGGGVTAAPALPPSTVLGAAPGTGSESLANVENLLEDIYSVEYEELTGIHDTMKSLNRNIMGLVTSIVRTGTTGASAYSSYSQPGFMESIFNNPVVKTIMTAGLAYGGAAFGMGLSLITGAFSLLTGGIGGLLLGGFLGSSLGKMAGKVFGGEKTTTLTSGGLVLGGGTVGDLMAGGGMTAQQYQHIVQTTSGGWFHNKKTSEWDQYSAIDAEVTRMFNLVFSDLSKTLVQLAKGLGVDTQKAMDYVFGEMRINLQGLTTGEQVEKAISEYISNIADIAARTLFGSIVEKYQKLSEGIFETAARLVSDIGVVGELLEMTNQQVSAVTTTTTNTRQVLTKEWQAWSVFQTRGWGSKPEPQKYMTETYTATETATEKIIAFTESLIELAGSLENLTEWTATYYDKFFTDAEKQARLQLNLSEALNAVNLSLPDTRMAYRQLVESLDLNTEAGRKQYVLLLELADGADQYYRALEDVNGSQGDLTKTLREQSTMIRDWIADLNRSSLAPVTSMETWQAEYERQKTIAYAPEATSQDVAGFLNYAKDYLSFMKTYGGNYADIYQTVVGDVQALGEIKDTALQQLDAIVAADEAARANANRIIAAITGEPVGPSATPPIRAYASGGLTSGPSLAGEKGREWIVPTYEPERSRFLESVPSAFWENLSGGAAYRERGGKGGGEITVHSHIYLDGKVVAENVAKQIPRSASLSEAIRRVN